MKEVVMNEIANNQGWARIANMYQVTGLLAFIICIFKAFMPFFVHCEMAYFQCLGIGFIFTFTGVIVSTNSFMPLSIAG